MSEKKVLLLGASALQLAAIRKAKELGVTCIAVDYDENAVGVKEVDKFYNISTIDYKRVLETAQKEEVDGIFTICSDRPMQIVAKVGAVLGLNTISCEAALLATNKAFMRNALFDNNVSIPKYKICKDFLDFKNAIKELGFPVIVKPSDNSGSRGISFIECENSYDQAYEYAKENSLDGVVLVEEFVNGDEVSVEAFVENGEVRIIQITDKITTGAPHFVEMGHNQPSTHPEHIVTLIKETTINAVKALKLEGGPVHAELKVAGDGVKVIELGARLGGDYIATDLVPLSTGVDLVEANIKWALGLPFNLDKKYSRYAAIRYIDHLDSIELDASTLHLLDHFAWNRLGSWEIQSSRDREGSFIVSDVSHANIEKKIELMRNALKDRCKKMYW